MCHIAYSYLDKVVFCTTRDNATANDFIKALNLTLKLLKAFSRMAVHTNRDKDGERVAKFLRIRFGVITYDNTSIF